MRDYYMILGVPRTAGRMEIRLAFRQLVRTYHPDVHPSREAVADFFRAMISAHEVLSDPVRRADYDRQWEAEAGQMSGAPIFQSSREWLEQVPAAS